MAVVPIDDYSPIRQYDTANPFIVQILHFYTKESQGISGATVSMHMQNVDDDTDIKTCIGPWVINAEEGTASYQYQAEDVDEPGSWKMWVKVEINSKIVHPDDGRGEPKVLVISPLPDGV